MSVMPPVSSAVPVTLATRTLGSGPRQVLALHCTLAHSGAWKGVASAFGDEVTLTCPDMPSHGKSPDWDGHSQFPDLMFDATAKLLTPGMDVIGHSFGATVALRLAAAFPERVRSLTLIEPVLFAVLPQQAPELLADQDRESAPYMAALADGDPETAARLFSGMWGVGGLSWDDLPEPLRASMIRGVQILPGCMPAVVDDTPGLFQPGVLDAVTMPVLLLRGDQTHDTMPPVLDGVNRYLPHARQAVIKGAGHMVPIT
ncbi:MAG: alpha/beta hydrolase, partial [Marinibacterium sp.]|nr:alpha/beta hydrolase [Marinibacterium sp.]